MLQNICGCFQNENPGSAQVMKKQARQQRILASVAANAAVSVSALARDLGVSKQTVRRDLDEMSESGCLNRTYGGAATLPVGVEPTLAERQKMAASERRTIAELAADLVADGDVLMLGPGSSTHYFAQTLVARFRQLQIITNSISAASVLASNRGFRVVLAPGDYQATEACVTGTETLTFLSKFRADKAIFGASGIYEAGVCEVNSGVAWVERTMVQCARERILLVAHIKFDQPHLELVCPFSELTIMVTDRAPKHQLMDSITAANVRIISPAVRS
ncbi:MAG: DeoR/GlpR family DNA-binding transcription regulator [Gammaproteobacteria bacterium]|nr:DeoR/GlpR family DNA-binding transcription regulator [Gammaproteobacteria bacterium]